MKLVCGPWTRDVGLEAGAARIDGRQVSFTPLWRDGALDALEIGGEVVPVRTAREGDRVFVWCAGGVFELSRAAGRAARAGEHAGDLVAPMPGRVRRVSACPGEKVGRGDVVVVLEAMKMEHAIRSPRDGVVSKILHGEGELVEAGTVLAEIV